MLNVQNLFYTPGATFFFQMNEFRFYISFSFSYSSLFLFHFLVFTNMTHQKLKTIPHVLELGSYTLHDIILFQVFTPVIYCFIRHLTFKIHILHITFTHYKPYTNIRYNSQNPDSNFVFRFGYFI